MGQRRFERRRNLRADVEVGEGRRIPLSPTVHQTLGQLAATRRQRMHSRVVRQAEGERYVFTAPRGGFLMNLNRVWYRAVKRARLEGLHFHDL